ncbi:hypothetical protein VE02_04092 [Pseudogymnoascus sp. 03VT05]|nr:hypothetical protein VE02_04092 [Pseudogymnoascus sp. 03VT05]
MGSQSLFANPYRRITSCLAVLSVVFLSGSAHGQTFDAQRSRCPLPCSESGPNPGNWTYYHNTRVLTRCDERLLLDLNVHNPVDDANTHLTFRACSNPEAAVAARGGQLASRQQLSYNTTSNDDKFHTVSAVTTPCGNSVLQTRVNVQLGWWDSEGPSEDAATAGDLAAAAEQLSHYLSSDATCGGRIILSSYRGAIVGVHVGSQVEKESAASLIDKFAKDTSSRPANARDRSAAQLCGGEASSSAIDIFGVFADATGSLSAVQEALKSWSRAQCLDGFDGSSTWPDMSLSTIPGSNIKITPAPSDGESETVASSHAQPTSIHRQGLGTVAMRWPHAAQSPNPNWRATMAGHRSAPSPIILNQYVCCSAGTLPDFSPKPGADGSCFSYTILQHDICNTIATAHHTTTANIEAVNKNTWGWMGCGDLQLGQHICLSTGTPPMPAPVAGTICGPQVPGTKAPAKGTTLASLNPCPLNSCCDIWGQCGTTPEFCTITNSTTKAPGTAAVGTYGCISNCGVDIIEGAASDVAYRRIAYFEAFSADRACLHMNPSDIDTSIYNYVHYAFGSITADFQVDVSTYPEKFANFVALKGTKRIMSFGGWSFSTDADTSPIFHAGVTDAQRATFVKSLLDFLNKYNLDGLDFDWEYPGATDIKGAEPGTPQDGVNYLAFLKSVKAALPAGRTVSIAAPASYWYVRNFPIASISKVVDYIVYMTYDLHGKWDYANKFVNEDCENGNCLRSHTNFTETYYAISMITKAGVPLNKVVIGMARYGRSFEMAKAGCTGPQCLFTGPESGATPGPCTNTSGYISNYEINQIISSANSPDLYGSRNITLLKDHTGESFTRGGYNELLNGDILVYDDTQWVSYVADRTYAARLFYWGQYHTGGSVDWAIDLVFDYSQGSKSDGTDDGDDGVVPPCDFTKNYNNLDDVVAAVGSITKQCAEIFTVNALSKELAAALANYTSVDNDYDSLFGYYVEAIKEEVPSAIAHFMNSVDGPGNKYFDCTWQVQGIELGSQGYTCLFDLKNSTGFYADLSANYGISADWVSFGDKDFPPPTVNGHQSGIYSYWKGFPQGSGNVNPTNPKDIVTAALPNMTMMQSTIDSTWMNQILGQWQGSGTDPAQVLAMPIAMVQQAIDSMAQVKVIGKAQSDADRQELILEIITAVLIVVPFVGGLGADITGLADLAGAIGLIGMLSNGAAGIFSIVKDPKSAPMVIFADLLGVGGGGTIRKGEQFGKLGKLRRAMTVDDVSKLGNVFTAQTSKIDKIIKKCS